MGRITSFSKQVIVFFLVTALIIRPTFAANVGGWNLSNAVAQGASTVYDASKNVVINGKDFVKDSWVKITPNASQVAKVLARGAAGYALSVAVDQLLGAVDWVLDPANNQVVYYKEPTQPKNCQTDSCKGEYIWYIDTVMTNGYRVYYSAPSQSLAISFYRSYMSNYGYSQHNINITSTRQSQTSVEYDHSSSFINQYGENFNISGTMVFYAVLNPNFDPQAEERERKTIPLETVAQQVISNAESDTDKRAAAQAATTTAAADIVAEAEKDDSKARPIASQAEANAETKPADAAEAEKANEATGGSKPNTANPEATDISLEFPIFCNWAPTVCEAAQVVISFPITLTEWWETGKTKAEEWATSISEAWAKVKEEYYDQPKENTDTELDIPDQSPPDINTDISFGGSCPASRSVPVSFAGINTDIEFSFQWFCDVAAIAKPAIISISAFASALIVAGVRTEDD